jgi:hypothetical protein
MAATAACVYKPPSSSRILNLPDDAFYHVMSFLKPQTIAGTERVCHAWRNMINHAFWQNVCLSELIRLPVEPQETLRKEIIEASQRGGFFIYPFIVTLIAAYEGSSYMDPSVNYKEFATSIQGTVTPYFSFVAENEDIVFRQPSDPQRTVHTFTGGQEPLTRSRWGDCSALFIRVVIRKEPSEKNGRGDFSSRSVEEVPFSLLMTKEGTVKETGALIRIKEKGTPILLRYTAFNHPHALSVDETIQAYLGQNRITATALEQTKTAASIQGEWINSD